MAEDRVPNPFDTVQLSAILEMMDLANRMAEGILTDLPTFTLRDLAEQYEAFAAILRDES